MPKITLLQSAHELNSIDLDASWVPAKKFDSRDRLVDEQGRTIGSDYQGRQYRIVQKWTNGLETIRFALPREETLMQMQGGELVFLRPRDEIRNEDISAFLSFKEWGGIPRICSLGYASLLDLLTLAKTEGLPLDLQQRTPEGMTLFNLWAGKGFTQIVELLLELDPSLIHQIHQGEKSLLIEAIIHGKREEVDLLLATMQKENVPLTHEEVWLQRAFQGDCNFLDLSEIELKLKVFYVANRYGHYALVQKLKDLGVGGEEPVFRSGLEIVATNMDIILVKNQIEQFLRRLRQDGCLFTAQEFSRLDKTTYIRKLDQIGRIQGKQFVEKIVRKYGFVHIKVPKKIAVIGKDLDQITFKVNHYLELRPKGGQMAIYAEKVQAVDRKISLEEAFEFMIVLEKTGFSDFAGYNFVVAHDGIYFIDTEYDNFHPQHPKFDAIKRTIEYLIRPEDLPLFLAEFEKRKAAFEEKEVAEPETNLAEGYSYQEIFVFPLSSLS